MRARLRSPLRITRPARVTSCDRRPPRVRRWLRSPRRSHSPRSPRSASPCGSPWRTPWSTGRRARPSRTAPLFTGSPSPRGSCPPPIPPFAALLFVPTAYVPLPVLKVAFVVGNAALLALLVLLSCRFAGLEAPRRVRPRRHRRRALAGTRLPDPALRAGQPRARLPRPLGSLPARRAPSARGSRSASPPGSRSRRCSSCCICWCGGCRREAAAALAGFAATVLLGALVLPCASVEFCTRRLFETGRVGKAWIVDNQSLQGLLARLLHTAEPGAVWAVARRCRRGRRAVDRPALPTNAGRCW